MMRPFLAMLCCVFFSANAEARQRHRATGLHPICNIVMPCVAATVSSPQEVRETRGRYIANQMGIGGPTKQRILRAHKARKAVSHKPRRHIDHVPAKPVAGIILKGHPEFLSEVPPKAEEEDLATTVARLLAILQPPEPANIPNAILASAGDFSVVLPEAVSNPLVPKMIDNGRAMIRSASGATAYVAAHAALAFQCVVNALETEGYRIREMGGFASHGHIRHSLHYSGTAIDINQIARNVTSPPMPKNEIAIANGCGTISGAQWANGDSGHFQFGGYDGKRTQQVAARHRHVRYAHRHHRDVRYARRHYHQRYASAVR